MKACRLASLVIAALFTLLAAGGANAAGLSGTYADASGVTQLVFKNDRVTITRLGIMQGIFKYTVDGKEITVEGANSGQAMLLEIDAKGCIVGVPGADELCKAGAGSNSSAPSTTGTQGVSGVYAGTAPDGGSYRFVFHADGTVEIVTAAMHMDATYTVDGKTVTIHPPKGAGSESDTIVLHIDGKGCLVGMQGTDKMCKVAANAAGMSGTGANTSGVVSVYTANDPDVGTVRYVFHKDGTVDISTGGTQVTATYKFAADKVTITLPKEAGGDSIVMSIDSKGCLYNPNAPTRARLCKR